MLSESRDSPNAASRGRSFPPLTAAARAAIDAHLLRVIEETHAGTLTDAERDELRASLVAQNTAVDVLRSFRLGNDDAPCFVMHPIRDIDGAT